MLSKECVFLLNYINQNASEEYLIISVEDILLEFPASYGISKSLINEMILILKNDGFISVKYNDGESFCVKSKEKGLLYEEQNKQIKISNKITHFKSFGWALFGGFLGAFLGTILLLIIIKI